VRATDELVRNAAAYASSFVPAASSPEPSRRVAVLACMDARIDVSRLLGLADGEAHVLRNAGGVVTDDVIRSLAISQRLLGTTEVIVIQHTDCGLSRVDDNFRRRLRDDAGVEPTWESEAFGDLEESVRRSLERIRSSPFVPDRGAVRGFVYDVRTGALAEVG
jgi:carbonic anhydrase